MNTIAGASAQIVGKKLILLFVPDNSGEDEAVSLLLTTEEAIALAEVLNDAIDTSLGLGMKEGRKERGE